MNIYIISIHHKVPSWINTGMQEYLKRIPKDFQLHFLPIAPIKKVNGTREQILELEREKIEKAINSISNKTGNTGKTSKKDGILISLDERGQAWDTKLLSQHLQNWQNYSQNIILLIGGSEGLSPQLIKQSHFCWSLSKLTFPHLFVQLIIVEQLYRAISLLKGHPYHRE